MTGMITSDMELHGAMHLMALTHTQGGKRMDLD